MMLKVSDTHIINLDTVTSVVELNDSNRVVFNFDYPITINKNGEELQRSDYHYVDGKNAVTLKEHLGDILERNNFIKLKNKYINPSHIALLKFDDERKRVIINLNTTISFKNKDNTKQLTSDFIYIDAVSVEEYSDLKKQILHKYFIFKI